MSTLPSLTAFLSRPSPAARATGTASLVAGSTAADSMAAPSMSAPLLDVVARVGGVAPAEFEPPQEMHDALALVHRIGGVGLLDKVITLFRATAEERGRRMRAAIAAGDTALVGRLAHATKGSAAQVGAERLRAAAAALEKEAPHLLHAALAERVRGLEDAALAAFAQLDVARRVHERTAGT